MKKAHIALHLFGVSAVTLVPIIAAADPVLNPSVAGMPSAMPRTTGQLFAAVQSVVNLQARDTRNDIGQDLRPRTPTLPLNAASALSRFCFGFSNGDINFTIPAGVRAKPSLGKMIIATTRSIGRSITLL
jgi:hypothetical protein